MKFTPTYSHILPKTGKEQKKMGMKRTIKKNVGYDVITINEAFEEYIAEKEFRNLSRATIKNYIDTYNMFMNFYEFDEATECEAIEQKLIYKWINTMKQKNISISSINHYLRDIRAFFYWCMEEPRQYINPPFKLQLLEKQEEPLKLFSDEELTLLLEKPRRNDSFATWRTWAIVNWVLGTGNRAATIVDVRIGDVNTGTREIQLRHTKNKKTQIIPLSNSLRSVFIEYSKMWRRDAGWSDYLFPNVGNEKLTTNGLRQAFEKYCTDRGVSRTNIHGLRHNFAKGWVQNNGNMFVLQKILGHSTLDMTRKYVKLFAEDLKEDFDKYNPLDNIKRNQKRTQVVQKATKTEKKFFMYSEED